MNVERALQLLSACQAENRRLLEERERLRAKIRHLSRSPAQRRRDTNLEKKVARDIEILRALGVGKGPTREALLAELHQRGVQCSMSTLEKTLRQWRDDANAMWEESEREVGGISEP